MLGAILLPDNLCEFTVWAPAAKKVDLCLVSPQKKIYAMEKNEKGYWITRQSISSRSCYFYSIDAKNKYPDPASHFQPKGVHGPSQVINHHDFTWQDQPWQGIPVSDYIIYEMHVGTFTPQGTLTAIISRLPELKELGITAIEIMPVAAFSGKRNWGYDGVYPYAVHTAYGGPQALKTLISACHAQGLAVILDVVYNHLGPEGNYLGKYGPYFSDRYTTPWGRAMNFDDAGSDEVRRFFIQNAIHWFEHYHVDALRLDAVQTIFDQSAYPFLAELADQVKIYSQKKGRHFYLIAESDLNDSRIHQPVNKGGYGMDASWCDDLHHSLHAKTTGESQGCYADFGSWQMLFKALRDGYAFTGQYSEYRKRQYGSSRQALPGRQLVVFGQNHDQVGNRLCGERLTHLVDLAELKWVAGLVLLSPYIPLLFMGEEYAETSPFLYFVSHLEPRLNAAVYRGRKRELQYCKGSMPDPSDRKTFLRSRLHWELRTQEHHKLLLNYYKKLIQLRKQIKGAFDLHELAFQVNGFAADHLMTLQWQNPHQEYSCIFYGASQPGKWQTNFPKGVWSKCLDSAETVWGGAGSHAPETLSVPTEIEFNTYQTVVYERTHV